MKKSLLFGAALAVAATGMAQLTPGEYYVKNVNTGMYLNEGYSWGTLAVTKNYPCPFEVTVNGDGYTFKSPYGYIKPDNGEYYMDGGDNVTVYLEKAGDYYNIKIGNKYLSINEERNYLTDEWLKSLNMCETILYTVNQTEAPIGDNKSNWEIISRADMEAALTKATAENPVEASFFLNAGQIEVNANNNISSWPYIKNNEKSEIILPDGGWFGHGEWCNKTTYAWCMNDEPAEDCTDIVSQEVTGMPAGYYSVSYRAVNQGNDGATPLVIKFNDTEASATNWEGTDLWYESAQNTMAHNVETASFQVGEDGKLTISMEKTSKAGMQNRFAFKSFSLNYIGAKAGIDATVVDSNDNAPVEYFNMLGVRVNNPENGLYIKRQGKKVSKVIVK